MQNRARTAWILFFALMSTVVVYVVVGLLVTAERPPPEMDPEQAELFTMIFMGMGLVSTALSFFLPRLVARPSPGSSADPAAAWLTGKILSWALGESIAIYGLVLVMITPDGTEALYAMAGWSLVVMALHAPVNPPGTEGRRG